MGHLGKGALVLAALLGTAARAVADPIAILSLRSQPGDYIGGGQTIEVTYRAPEDRLIAQVSTLADGRPSGVSFVLLDREPLENFATVSFSTHQLGVPFQPGEYVNAERAPFASPGHPGLDVTFRHRGSNTLTGAFTISDVDFVRNDMGLLQIARLRASFEQHSEGAAPALFGTFAFDAAPVPEPGTLILLGSGLTGLVARRRRHGMGGRAPSSGC